MSYSGDYVSVDLAIAFVILSMLNIFFLIELYIAGLPDQGGLVCGESCVVLVAFRHPAGRLCCLLLADLLGAPT